MLQSYCFVLLLDELVGLPVRLAWIGDRLLAKKLTVVPRFLFFMFHHVKILTSRSGQDHGLYSLLCNEYERRFVRRVPVSQVSSAISKRRNVTSGLELCLGPFDVEKQSR